MATKEVVGNVRFLIADFIVSGSDMDRKQIYLLNPGDIFEGFGGSRSGLVVKKTASLVVRESGVGGSSDTEYDVNDRGAWDRIFRMATNAGYNKMGKCESNGPALLARKFG